MGFIASPVGLGVCEGSAGDIVRVDVEVISPEILHSSREIQRI